MFYSNILIKNSILNTKTLFILLTIFNLQGCVSFKNQTEKLSVGIQKAYNVPAQTANQISPIILENAEKHNISPTLMAAVIRQESHFKSNARSSGGAIGLMQIIPKYWSKTCPGDLYNINNNIACGSHILSHYHDKAGNWNKALAYYNVGPAGYENNRQAKKNGKKYAKSVKAFEKKLKKEM